MANKIFQLKNISLGEDYIWPARIDENVSEKVQYLTSNSTHSFFSYDINTTTITTTGINSTKYDVRNLDKIEDAELLNNIKNNSQFIRLSINNIQQKVREKYTDVTIYIALANDDVAVKTFLTENKLEQEDFITGLGF